MDDRRWAGRGQAGSPTRGPRPTPFSVQTQHAVRVAWAAAEIEHADYRWNTARELALAPDRWGAEVSNERGGRSRRLPDLVFWPAPDEIPVAVIVVHGPPKPRREQATLEGWRNSLAAGQYAQVRCLAHPNAAHRLEQLAVRIGLAAPQFTAGDRVVLHEPAVVPSNVAQMAIAAEPVATLEPEQRSGPPPFAQCSTSQSKQRCASRLLNARI